MSNNWYDDPDARAWLRHAQEELPPKVGSSSFVMSLCTGEPDAKFCVELGFAIMLDKPIVLVATPGVAIPERLRRIANSVIELDHELGPESSKEIAEKLIPVMAQLGLRDNDDNNDSH